MMCSEYRNRSGVMDTRDEKKIRAYTGCPPKSGTLDFRYFDI